jgi:hypothetical protein
MEFPEDKKLSVLHRLSQESNFIGLKELLQKIGNAYSERSVRRWLSELIKEGLVEKRGQKRATKYKVIRRSERQREGFSGCFTGESIQVIENIKRPLYERSPVTYKEEWLKSYQPNITSYIPLPVRKKLHEAGKRCRREDPAGTFAHKIFSRLLIDLSYNSSRLEGNTYSLLDTQKLILEGTGVEGKLDEEKIMILNHKEAIRFLVDTAPRLEVTKETVYTLHYLLSDGLVDPSFTGKIRNHEVRISGSTYIPFENPKVLKTILEHIIETASKIDDPYEQSLFLLIHITYLQAFTDVNKRTARLSANIPLIKNNLVPLSFNDVERDDYTSAIIAIYELQDIHPLMDLYVFSYMRTCAMYDSTVKGLGFDEVRVRTRSQRRAIVRTIILEKLVGEKMREYLVSESQKVVQEKDRSLFIEDVLEDLQEIDQSRIAGLGISPDQLTEWIELKNSFTF